MKKALCMLMLGGLFLTSCKKDDTPDDNQGITVNADGSVNVGNDAAGALYAIQSKVYHDNSGSGFFEEASSTAWFGSPISTQDAGDVSVNGVMLEKLAVSGMTWYMLTDPVTFDPAATSNVSWTATGNGAAGISAINYVDAAAWPSQTTFTLPNSLNLSAAYTLNHASSGNADAVVYSAIGDNGTVNTVVMGGSTSYTFTAAQLQEAATSGSYIDFSVMPIRISKSEISGKMYYFVKQYQTIRGTETL